MTFLRQKRLSQFLGGNWCTGFACHLTESRDDARGDGPWFSVADRSPIRLYDRDDPCCSGREEAFVSNKNIMARNAGVAGFDAKFGADFNYCRACNPWQRAGHDPWRVNLTG